MGYTEERYAPNVSYVTGWKYPTQYRYSSEITCVPFLMNETTLSKRNRIAIPDIQKSPVVF